MGLREGIGVLVRYDVIVIGGGVAGYNTAVRAGQLGLRVACVERTSKLGGAGLNTGCIPSQVLLHASEMYDAARNGGYAALGIESVATLNLARMMAYKSTTVNGMSEGLHSLLRKHKVALFHGEARLAGPEKVVIRKADGSESTLFGRDVVIATGSESIPLPAAEFDHIHVLDSADALSLERVPRHLAIIGAGAIGVEIGSIWRRLGARVTLIERSDRICSRLDHEVASSLEHALRRQGMDIRVSTEVVSLDVRRDGVRLQLRPRGGDGDGSLDAELVLVAIGRRPATRDLALRSAGLQADPQGVLHHHEGRTNVPGIWVVGDATTGPMLAHKAEEEAIACAEQIAGLPGFVDYSSIPNVLYTTPGVAMIGATEKELRARGVTFKVGCFPIAANARARIHGASEGFVKLLVDARTDLIAGAHFIGPGAADLISEVGVAIEASTICEDLARICHPYPTWAEALRQAAMSAGGWMMHA